MQRGENTWGCQAAGATSRDFGEAQPWPTNGMEKEEKLLVKKQLAHENLLAEDVHDASQKWGKQELSLTSYKCKENHSVFLTHLLFPLQQNEAFSGKKQICLYEF